jgi:TonB-like protein
MNTGLWRLFPALGLALLVSLGFAAQGFAQNGGDSSQNAAQAKKLPTEAILVKGAWSSASDSVTPVPEGGGVVNGIYRNDYFRLTYPLPRGWTEKYTGPPPSDSGYYVLAQVAPADARQGVGRGSILIAAQDMFFTLTSSSDALELINYTQGHLSTDYKVEWPPTEVRIASHSFVRFEYFSPVAELHWQVLATQIRCHTVEFVFTTRDTDLIESLIQQMNSIQLPGEADPTFGAGGGDVPMCIKNYARDENIIEKEDPVFAERTFNAVPVRVVIDKDGKIKYIHFLSAFPAQAKSIADALEHWRFKPFLRDGQPVEVETGIVFGRAPASGLTNTAVSEKAVF